MLINEPSVPPQQYPLARSYPQPPDVPSLIGGVCFAVWETLVPPPPLCGNRRRARKGWVKRADTPTPLTVGGRERFTSSGFFPSESTKTNSTIAPLSSWPTAVP